MAVLAGILIIGVPLDVIAGYKGGMIDGITMRMVDIVCTFPSSLVGLAVVGILDPGLQIIMLVLVSLWWAPLARMVRGEVLQIREEGYITAANEQIIIFNLSNAMPAILISQDEGNDAAKRRVDMCPEEWNDDFGEEFYEHVLRHGELIAVRLQPSFIRIGAGIKKTYIELLEEL